MLYRKEGVPEEGEIVLCTVTQVQYNSVFVRLDEYDKSGMIHISEISPGRIRNIRDFVKEGKIIVCKVLRYYAHSGHIDLSLRRVTEIARRNKLDEMKQEQKAEKIIDMVSKVLKRDMKELYEKVTEKVFVKYGTLNECFNEVSLEKANLEEMGVEPAVAKEITTIVSQRVKPTELMMKGDFTITSYAPEGVEIIKKAISQVKDPETKIRYIKAGQYRMEIKGLDVKEIDKKLQKYSEAVCGYAEKNGAQAKFAKIEES